MASTQTHILIVVCYSGAFSLLQLLTVSAAKPSMAALGESSISSWMECGCGRALMQVHHAGLFVKGCTCTVLCVGLLRRVSLGDPCLSGDCYNETHSTGLPCQAGTVNSSTCL